MTELSPSPITLMYCTPCMSSAALKPLTIISVSIKQEEQDQFLKQVCSFGDTPLFLATVHEEEKQLAEERGDIVNGYPTITVIVDGGGQKDHTNTATMLSRGLALL